MVVTKELLMNRIQYYQDKINDLEKQIALEKEKIETAKKDLTKLAEFENSPIEERTLRKKLYPDTTTVDIFDDFEELTSEGFQKYKRLIFDKGFYFSGKSWRFIVERLHTDDYVGDTTMTKFKTGNAGRLYQYAREELMKNADGLKDVKEIVFSKPYHLRAQNSSNRTGYGSIYEGDYLVHEGTEYGETTDYAFVGLEGYEF